MKQIMSEGARQSFLEWSELASSGLEEKFAELLGQIFSGLGKMVKTNSYDAPANLIDGHFSRFFPDESPAERARLQFAFAAKLALNTQELLEEEDLPQSILDFYPRFFDRAESDFRNNYLATDFSPHRKYARLFTAQSVPCGARVMDLKSSVPLSSVILGVARMRDVRPVFRYVSVNGSGVWFRSHTDTGYLDEFSEEGLDRFYLRVAELLKRRKNVRGLVGTSWFYDPLLGKVSPRLGYLFSNATSRGAFCLKHRTTEFDVQMALKTSQTRRRLFEEGKYVPMSYSIIWPREKLLSWADGNSRSHGLNGGVRD